MALLDNQFSHFTNTSITSVSLDIKPDLTCHWCLVWNLSRRRISSAAALPPPRGPARALYSLYYCRCTADLNLFSGRWCILAMTRNGMRFLCHQFQVGVQVRHVSWLSSLALDRHSDLAGDFLICTADAAITRGKEITYKPSSIVMGRF